MVTRQVKKRDICLKRSGVRLSAHLLTVSRLLHLEFYGRSPMDIGTRERKRRPTPTASRAWDTFYDPT
jgi:hypothetical protein